MTPEEVNQGFTILFSGMSGSGKFTIGRGVGDALRARGLQAEVLDSGTIRQQLIRNLDRSREAVGANLLMIGERRKNFGYL